jgi:hypothetical protein
MTAIAEETWVFRWEGFSPSLSLLMPTFAFLTSPADGSRPTFADVRMLSYHHRFFIWIHRFGDVLDARLLSMPAPLDQ